MGCTWPSQKDGNSWLPSWGCPLGLCRGSHNSGIAVLPGCPLPSEGESVGVGTGAPWKQAPHWGWGSRTLPRAGRWCLCSGQRKCPSAPPASETRPLFSVCVSPSPGRCRAWRRPSHPLRSPRRPDTGRGPWLSVRLWGAFGRSDRPAGRLRKRSWLSPVGFMGNSGGSPERPGPPCCSAGRPRSSASARGP